MWVNIRFAHESGWNLKEIMFMQILLQNRTEDLENELAMYANDEMLDRFHKEGIIDTVRKKRKDDSDFSTYRLSKKGRGILENVQTPEITQGDLKMFDYLTDNYLSHDEERMVGNKKKVKQYCVQFRRLLGLTLHEFYWLTWHFIENYPYTKKLENIFMDSNKHRYGTLEANLNDSPLFQHYERNKDEITELWQKRIKN